MTPTTPTALARILAGMFIALLALAATPAHAEHRSGGIWVKYQDLPRRVRETIDRERAGREVKQIIEFRHQDRAIYRVLVDERGSDRAILVSESGRVLRESEVPDLPVGQGWFERPIRYADLPPEVRRTLDRERGDHEVRALWFVRRDNREFYRAIVDTRGDDLAIRINSVGKLLSIDEVDDYAFGSREASRYDYNRERMVRFEDLPHAVRRTIEREAERRPLKEIVQVERNGRVFYRVVVDDRRGDRILRIAEDGYLYEEREVPDISFGPGGYDSNRWGHEMRMSYADLPWEVRTTLDRERRGREVKEIIYVRRFNHSFYRCLIDTRGDDLAVRISDDGRLLSREEVEDTAIGRGELDGWGAREDWVKYNTLPPGAQRTLDRYRDGRAVLKIIRIESRGRILYRCTIDTRPWPSTLTMTEDGQPLGR